MELAVGAKYAKKVRKRLAALLEPPPEPQRPAAGSSKAVEAGAGERPAMPEAHRFSAKLQQTALPAKAGYMLYNREFGSQMYATCSVLPNFAS